VQRKRAQVQGVGEGLDVFDEVLGALKGKRVVHGGGRWSEAAVGVS
jgi:hypothetical protein